jgi:hypothetical protein
MAITVKHKFVSAIPDAGDTTIVQPSNWNDTHDLTGTVPIANGGTNATTANDGLNNLLPSQTGNNGKVLATDGTNASWTTNGSGDVVGPASATDNAVARFDTTTGKLIKNSGVTIDNNNNIVANALDDAYTNTAASGTAITLTVASPRRYTITGSGGQVIKLPDATTLANGTVFQFDNNQSSGAITVNNNSNTLVVSVPSGGFVLVNLLSNSIAAGSWDRHDQAPANVSWSTNTFDYAGSITSATWNGNTVAVNRGGTGQSTYTDGQLLIGNSTGNTLTKSTLTAGTGISVTNSAGGITIANTSPSSGGTVTSVATAGTVNGLTLTGGPITTTGTVTLGGTLDLSSPPTIGNIAPNTGKFTTLESTGTATLASASTTYVTITGDASYPMVKATGGTNTPLVLSPLGTGALQAQKTDSTATGGNARGANAVDWQTSRSGATRVASGAQSTVSGGDNNGATAVNSVVAGGTNNVASGTQSFIGSGNGNVTTNPYSNVIGGYGNTAAGYYNFIGAGFTNSGTASAAVTTQSGTMNGTTAVTLSGSNASIKVGQYITGTSIAAFTYVAAISGTSLTLSQNASGSSTSTLSFYTPHGVVVGGGNNQATGAYSFIGGGGDAGTAANRNIASGDWSTVAGGAKNTASGAGSFIGGGGISAVSGSIIGNTAGGVSSFIGGGYQNIANGGGSVIGGGSVNTTTGLFTTIVGGRYGTDRGISGYTVFSSCDVPIAASQGVSQGGLLVLGRETTNATATVLTSNTGAAGSTNQVILPNNSAYYFKARVISGVTGGGNTKAWTLEGAIKRGAGVGTTAIVGSVTTTVVAADAGASTWTVTATADTTNGGLAITFTGQAATTIRTVAKIETAEMTF